MTSTTAPSDPRAVLAERVLGMWQPVGQHSRLSERIVTQVEQLLADEELKPGDRLPPEREMAQMLGVSRPSLREAVRILQARGRLLVKHGQGVFVTAPSSQREVAAALGDVRLSTEEMFAMREVLEVPAARWAAERVTARHLDTLRGVLDELHTAVEATPSDLDRIAELDARFHLTIAGAAGNRFLQQTSHLLSTMILSGMETTLLIPGRRERSRVQHERILAALAAGDPGAAARAARMHIRSALSAALSRMGDDG